MAPAAHNIDLSSSISKDKDGSFRPCSVIPNTHGLNGIGKN
jgi:hypothetical protein